MPSFFRVVKARILGFLRPNAAREDFDEELRAHLDLAVDDKVRQGLSPKEARRQARVELGNLTLLREAATDARGLPWLDGAWLDLKLGARMLRKSWGLTLVAGFAMTLVIGLAAMAFEVLGILEGTELPLDEGDRVVALQGWDPATGDGVGTSAADFELWQRSLRSVVQVSAFREVERNLQLADATGQPLEATAPGEATPGEAIEVAEISPGAFQLARVMPAMGRTLVEEDERGAADPVLLISHRAWRTRFQADPSILGRRVQLDGTVHAIVGVMPEGFGFPVAHHYWTPLRLGLRLGPGSYTPEARSGDLFVFARLADGASPEKASAELRQLGRVAGDRIAEDRVAEDRVAGNPTGATATDAEPELRVVPYASAFLSDAGWAMNLAGIVFLLLLVPPCLNIAILIYARTITRQGEFSARFVLGASRFRIVFQLFLEILVLATCAGGAALVIARVAVWHLVAERKSRGELPFWMDISLSPRTVLVVALLAIFAALLAGVIPALRATGHRMQTGLKSLGGPEPARLGALWTMLIVLQVAVSTALLPTSAEMVWGTVRSGLLGPGFAAEQYVTARLAAGNTSEDAATAERFEQRQRELVRRLEARPDIAAVTVTSHVPGNEPWFLVADSEAGEEDADGIGSHRVAQVNHVDASFFDTFQVRLLAGRAFESGDFDPSRHSVVVNRSFAENVLGDGLPIGRRIVYRARRGETLPVATGPEAEYEIVGLVADIHRHSDHQAVYHPRRSASHDEASLALRIRSEPAHAAGVLRATTWSVDPVLRLGEIRSLADLYRQQAVGNWVGAGALVAVTLSLLLLSAAGVYALMSFTVGRRRKEIGIRAALGASPRALVSAVFRRALTQVALGAFVGVWIALLVDHYLPVQNLGGWELPGAIPAATVFVAAIAALALVGPARRGLQVEPVDELREG